MERERTCKNCGNEFVIEKEDFNFYKKINVPPPTFCPECRTIRRLLFRNERAWYHKKCSATGKMLLSMYAPETPYKIYDYQYWKSDAWDPLDYGNPYDFSRTFFDQFNSLFREIPHPNLIQKNNINSEYSNHALNLKNCYFCAGSDTAENSSYFFGAVLRLKNSLDVHQSSDCEFCYELTDCLKSNRLFWGQNCEACVDSILLYDCRNCQNCFGCAGLRNKNYHIFNKQYSKEEYEREIRKYWNGGYSKFLEAKKKFEELKLKTPRKYAFIIKSVNVTGDDISESRNCKYCFNTRNNIENCKYGFRIHDNTKDGYDTFVSWNKSELFYETLSISGQNILFSAFIWGGFNIEYSFNCFDCNNIFGCVGLRNKSYCILNKQYSKEEYKKLLSEIKKKMLSDKEYGEFFPGSISPFAYNETLAQEYFSKDKERAIKEGYFWREPEEKKYDISVSSDKIEDNIKNVSDSYLQEIIECEHKGKCNEQCSMAFRLTEFELNFYKSMNIPPPRLCPFCRHYARLRLKNPPKLWHRKCMCENDKHEHPSSGGKGCQNEFKTSYAPERPEIVYCEECYNKEVY